MHALLLSRSCPDKVAQPVRSTLNLVVVPPVFNALVCPYLTDHKQETFTQGKNDDFKR